MWRDEEQPMDASVLLYEALSRNDEELEEIDLSDLDDAYAPAPRPKPRRLNHN